MSQSFGFIAPKTGSAFFPPLRLKNWKNERMKEWKIERMKNWKNEKLKEWKIERRRLEESCRKICGNEIIPLPLQML